MAATTIKIRMKSTKSPYYFTTTKNPRNVTEKLKLKRYDPVVRQHVEFNEAKIK